MLLSRAPSPAQPAHPRISPGHHHPAALPGHSTQPRPARPKPLSVARGLPTAGTVSVIIRVSPSSFNSLFPLCLYPQTLTDRSTPPLDFKEEDIIETFCAARPDNCVNGQPKSDPYQALYVCVPPAANPQDTSTPSKKKYPYKSIKAPRDTLTDNAENQELDEELLLSSPETEKVIAPRNHHDNIKAHSNPDTATNTLQKLLNLRWLRPPHPWPQALAATTTSPFSVPATTTGTSLPFVPATTTTHTPFTPSSSPASGGSGSGSSNSGSAGTGVTVSGNRIELLCSCSGGQCVNPAADHIGRCETPCL